MLILLFFLSSIGTEPPSGKVHFCAVGDVLLDRGVRTMIKREGLNYPFKFVKDTIRNYDLAFCNLECPVCATGYPLNKKYCFRGDTSFINSVVDAGFDIISIANNHTLDWGREGFMETMNLLKKKGLYPIGGGKNQTTARKPTIITLNGLKFAFFGFVDMLPDAIVYLKDKPGPAYASTKEIIKEIRKVRNKVDFIIVSIHWGIEFNRYPTMRQIEKAHKMIDAGADLIIGHHPHVLQSIEVYKKRPIIYSMGNFVFDQHKLYQRQSAIFTCVFSRGKVDSISLIPILIKKFRPTFPEKSDREKIMKKIIGISSKFATKFERGKDKLFLTIDSTYSFEKRIGYYNWKRGKLSIYKDKIILRDSVGKIIDLQPMPESLEIKDCCFINDSLGIHLYGIAGDKDKNFGERIFTATVADTLFIGPFVDPHTLHPWKIMKAEVDGDNRPEICVGVWKKTRYDSLISNRLFIYNTNGPYIYPKWLGSSLSSPLLDFDFKDVNSDGMDELITLELNEDGTKKINVYKWSGFGFDLIKTLKKKQKSRIIPR